MRGFQWIYLTCVILNVFCLVQGKLLCFRKVKKNNKCAGIIRKGGFDSVEKCCARKGSGYALKKQKVGKNRFKCLPCGSELKDEKRQRKGRKGRGKGQKKERKNKKEKTFVSNNEHPTWSPPSNTYVAPRRPFPILGEAEEEVEWGPWSPCTVTCGAGWRSRFKICDDCDKNDYENVQSQPCMLNFYCPVDGSWGPWFPWQPCSKSCNGGTRIRQRKCNYPPPAYGGKNCPGEAESEQQCNDHRCPVDGNWGDWTQYSACSATCGQGVRRRSRSCDNPAPKNGGRDCRGPRVDTERCEVDRCPQDGQWSLWAPWAQCPVTCGQGFRTRTRACDSPRPLYGGKTCEGEAMDHQDCYGGRPCPVDGAWTDWTNYGFCRAPRCGRGYQIRSRSCADPRPQHGGRPCVGHQYERVECYNEQNCPRNGAWCDWGNWSACSSTCKENTALQVRQRDCKCPEPKSGGAVCKGDSLQVRECDNLQTCRQPNKALTEDAGEEEQKKKCSAEDHVTGSGDGSDVNCDEEPESEDETVAGIQSVTTTRP